MRKDYPIAYWRPGDQNPVYAMTEAQEEDLRSKGYRAHAELADHMQWPQIFYDRRTGAAVTVASPEAAAARADELTKEKPAIVEAVADPAASPVHVAGDLGGLKDLVASQQEQLDGQAQSIIELRAELAELREALTAPGSAPTPTGEPAPAQPSHRRRSA